MPRHQKSTFPKMGTKITVPANKGVSYIAKKYQGMHPLQRKKQSSLDASNNGKCWWVYTFLMGNELAPKRSKGE